MMENVVAEQAIELLDDIEAFAIVDTQDSQAAVALANCLSCS